MDASLLRDLLPNADPGFLKAWKALSLSPDVARHLRTYAVVLHDLYLKKKDAFARRDWKEWESLLRAEAGMVEDAVR